MVTTQFTVYMRPGEVRKVHVSVHPDYDAHAYCSDYSTEAPILSVSHADVSVTVSPQRREAVGEADLRFARDLAEAAKTYLAEITRLYTDPPALTSEPATESATSVT